MGYQTRSVKVTGHVQGVGFRAFVRDTARDLGIDGWVRNASDGSVEAVIGGPQDTVERMTGKLREGPAGSRVDGVELSETNEPPDEGFEIRQ